MLPVLPRTDRPPALQSYIQKQVKPLFEHYKNVTGNWTDVPLGLMDQ